MEFILCILVVWIVVDWIREKLKLSPEATFDCASVGCGLYLVVAMTVMGIVMWNTPGLERGFTLYFFLWAVFGLVLMVKGIRGR